MSKFSYDILFGLFRDATPLKADCGAVCGGACCKGDDTVGMLLFPGEPSTLPVAEADGRRYVLCGGHCEREARPLACRVFPLFPAVDEAGRVRVIADPRAFPVCPLARQAENVRFDPRFARRVKKAGKLLATDPACFAFLRELTDELDEIVRMNELLK